MVVMEKVQISNRQFSFLVIMFSLGSSTMIVPQYIIINAGQDAWISAIVATVFSILVVTFYSKLINLYPKKSLIETYITVVGKWVGSLIGLLYFSYFMVLASGLLRQAGDFITTEIMPETPIQALMILILIVVIIAVRLGVEVFARTSEIFLPWIVGLFLVLTITLLPKIELINIQPVLEDGIKPILKGTYMLLGIPFIDFIVLLMITPYVKDQSKIKKSFIIGSLIGGCLITVIVSLTLLVLGPELAERSLYITYDLGKQIEIGNFLERVELIVAIIWLITIFIKITISFYISCLSLAQIFKLKDYRSLTLPLGMVVIPLAIILVDDLIAFNEFVTTVFTPYVITLGLILPIFLYLIGKIKKKVAKS
jgi:spore germination protein KB